LVLRNAPPATTTVPATETPPVQQKTEVEEQKDVTDPEADPNMTNLPEATSKDEQEDPAATKPGEKSYLLFFLPLFYDLTTLHCVRLIMIPQKNLI
jgi:hypothetical protein